MNRIAIIARINYYQMIRNTLLKRIIRNRDFTTLDEKGLKRLESEYAETEKKLMQLKSKAHLIGAGFHHITLDKEEADAVWENWTRMVLENYYSNTRCSIDDLRKTFESRIRASERAEELERKRELEMEKAQQAELEESINSHKSKTLLELYQDSIRMHADSEDRIFGSGELVSYDGEDYIEENFGDNDPGFNGVRRRIVEKDINGKWVKDESGHYHVKKQYHGDE